MTIAATDNPPNTIVFIVQIDDVSDEEPILNDKPFYLAAIDNMKFGTTVFAINVSLRNP